MNKMKWISVKDRLPKFDDTVLVYFESGLLSCQKTHIGRLDVIYYRKDKYGSEITDAYFNVYNDEDLKSPDYWMPLPEPPKED